MSWRCARQDVGLVVPQNTDGPIGEAAPLHNAADLARSSFEIDSATFLGEGYAEGADMSEPASVSPSRHHRNGFNRKRGHIVTLSKRHTRHLLIEHVTCDGTAYADRVASCSTQPSQTPRLTMRPALPASTASGGHGSARSSTR